MGFSPAPRRFLATAPFHLAAWGLLTASGAAPGSAVVSFDGRLWLFLVGFVGFVILGFAWHLFPSISRRRLVGIPTGRLFWGLAELSVVLGVAGRSTYAIGPSVAWPDMTAAVAWFLVLATFSLSVWRSAARAPSIGSPAPSARRADRPAAALFLSSWTFGLAAGAAWTLSAAAEGPGFGYWLVGVHLFLLGQVALLIFAVSLRLLPRFVGADGPRGLAEGLGVLGVGGAVGMPTALLLLPLTDGALLLAPGALEGGAALLFLLQLVYLGARATTPRRALLVSVASSLALIAGGGLGLVMVDASAYRLVVLHAYTNLLGFVTVMIGGMWFSMIAPYQFVSHRLGQRVLAATTGLLLAAVGLSVLGAAADRFSTLGSSLAGALVGAVGMVWAAGSLPVLYAPAASPRAG